MSAPSPESTTLQGQGRSPREDCFDEEKCRNVLVRFCSHIPRNYQYRDGIPEVFLILREHMGDEVLDLAGGVLYELIEIDCPFSDDAGAGFQRWRWNHMRRGDDLNLPHVPHMMTITSAIRPTARLVRWRADHPERYRSVLSDASTGSFPPSGGVVRTKKAWAIEHTLYVSSRDGGTRPIRSMSAKEFHKLQWDSSFGRGGKLVQQRQITVPPSESAQEAAETEMPGPSESARATGVDRETATTAALCLDEISLAGPKQSARGLVAVSRPGSKQGAELVDRRPGSWLDGILPGRWRPHGESRRSVPLPADCWVPNPVFIRKNVLTGADQPLSPSLSVQLMPAAEAKALEILAREKYAHFRGPFTPQLRFDGGLDHRQVRTTTTGHLDGRQHGLVCVSPATRPSSSNPSPSSSCSALAEPSNLTPFLRETDPRDSAGLEISPIHHQS